MGDIHGWGTSAPRMLGAARRSRVCRQFFGAARTLPTLAMCPGFVKGQYLRNAVFAAGKKKGFPNRGRWLRENFGNPPEYAETDHQGLNPGGHFRGGTHSSGSLSAMLYPHSHRWRGIGRMPSCNKQRAPTEADGPNVSRCCDALSSEGDKPASACLRAAL